MSEKSLRLTEEKVSSRLKPYPVICRAEMNRSCRNSLVKMVPSTVSMSKQLSDSESHCREYLRRPGR